MIALVAAGVAYGKRQKSAREKTQSELMLTERLLGDVQHEKDIVTKEKSRMDQVHKLVLFFFHVLLFTHTILRGRPGALLKTISHLVK